MLRVQINRAFYLDLYPDKRILQIAVALQSSHEAENKPYHSRKTRMTIM